MMWRLGWVAGGMVVAASSWAMSVSNVQLSWDLPAGVYRCAYGESLIGVERQQEPEQLVKIHYKGRVHALTREPSSSGLPRYSNAQAGLLWVDLPWKGVLLNLATERPIANDCTHTAELTLAQLSQMTAAPSKKREVRQEAKGGATEAKETGQRVARADEPAVKR